MTALNQLFPEPEECILEKGNYQTIVLKIETSSILNCLEYMLTQRISFEVDFSKPIKFESKQHVPNDENNLKLPVAPIRQSDSMILEGVYEKYILNYKADKIPKVKDIATEFGISEQKLSRIFFEKFGQTIYQANMRARMDRGAELLKQGYKACEVAKIVGYGNHSDIKFNKMFQKYFGMTPKRYQLEH